MDAKSLAAHHAACAFKAIPVLEKLVHAKGTRPNKTQMWKKCACSQTAEQLIMGDPVSLSVMHHSCKRNMHAYCADVGVNTDMTSNLSFTCGGLEIVAGCLYCQH